MHVRGVYGMRAGQEDGAQLGGTVSIKSTPQNRSSLNISHTIYWPAVSNAQIRCLETVYGTMDATHPSASSVSASPP